jgi:large subunit ribosomal protein L25
MIKEVQFEPVSRHIAHVDFQEISASETITLAVPIRVRGTPAGVNEGGVLDVVLHELEVEARASQVPEEIRVDVSQLQIGDAIRAGEVKLPEGLKLATESEATVLAVEHPRGEEDAEAHLAEGEAEAQPEVLTGKKEEAAAGAEAPGEQQKPEAGG